MRRSSGDPRQRSTHRWPVLLSLLQRVMPRQTARWSPTPPRLRLAPVAIALWHERADVRATFDLARVAGRRGLAQWLMFHGLRETCFELDAEDLAAMAPWHDPWPGLVHAAEMPVSWLMRVAARREGLTPAELREPERQREVVRGYVCRWLAKYGWSRLLSDAQVAVLMADDVHGVARLVVWLWEDTPELQARFATPADPALRHWLRTSGASRWPVLTDPRIALADPVRPPVDPDRPFGVNLVGHARGRLGVGEDVRMAAAALAAVGIPYVIRDVAPDRRVGADDDSVLADLSDEMPYRFTMLCTAGMETVRAMRELGGATFAGQMVIGFWPWEMPEWPTAWQGAYDFVDEVWASTRYTYDAYVRSSPRPVRVLPMAVRVEESAGLGRVGFGLPDDRFLFVFAYDALSHAARKNPGACVAAFDRAFPRGDEPVGLVIKGMRVADDPGWQALVERARHDPRLFLVDQSLERGALLDLYRACDCFVSLHRAEGFGRNIAECMALGRPVIVTAHSGNMDFTRPDNAALVPARLRAVAAGDYPFSTGQLWAEPDVDIAAAMMRRMLDDVPWREERATAGARTIAELYAPAQVGRQWQRLLEALAATGA